MAMYITLSEGPRADMAVPILATGDQRIIQAVLSALTRIARETTTSPDAPAVGIHSRARSRRAAPLQVLTTGGSHDG
jgi:hypothetical protein